jgi:prevent-host-death family protein
MAQFNISTAKAHLSELIQEAMLGHEIVIARDNQPLVKLVAYHPSKIKRKVGTARGMIEMAEDFNAPLADFKDYTTAP